MIAVLRRLHLKINYLQYIAQATANQDQLGTSTQLSLAKASYYNNKVPKQLSEKQFRSKNIISSEFIFENKQEKR